MKVIGVSGKKRSGKDTLAHELGKIGYENYAFADNIKQACKEVFGFTDNQLWGDAKEDIDPYWKITPRHALQVIGTDMFRREFGDHIWIDSLKKDLIDEAPDKAIISDVRFPNEVESIQKWGGIVVYVDALDRLDAKDGHASETALDGYDGFDYVIDNNGSIEEFADRIDDFIQDLRGPSSDIGSRNIDPSEQFTR